MPTKTKTSARKGSKKPTDNELPEERITLKTVFDAAVDVHGRLNRMEFEMKARPTDPPPAEKWVPLVVGSFVKKGPHFHSPINDPGAGTPDDAVGVVAEVRCDDDPRWHLYGCDFPRASARVFGFTRPGGANHFTPLSDAEIAEHKRTEEESKVTELQEGDQCDRVLTKEEVFEVLALGLPSGDSEILSTSCRCLVWINGRIAGNFIPGDQHNSIPFHEFLRRAKGTAARLKSEAEAKELAMPLTFGTRVKSALNPTLKGRLVWDEADSDGEYAVMRDDRVICYWKRSEFSVIP